MFFTIGKKIKMDKLDILIFKHFEKSKEAKNYHRKKSLKHYYTKKSILALQKQIAIDKQKGIIK
jgi:hypothetical protein